MNTLLKTNQTYGASVGHRTVLTRSAAIERYNAFLEVCYNPLSTESASVLADVQNDLVKIGFTWEEIEQLEKEYLRSL